MESECLKLLTTAKRHSNAHSSILFLLHRAQTYGIHTVQTGRISKRVVSSSLALFYCSIGF